MQVTAYPNGTTNYNYVPDAIYISKIQNGVNIGIGSSDSTITQGMTMNGNVYTTTTNLSDFYCYAPIYSESAIITIECYNAFPLIRFRPEIIQMIATSGTGSINVYGYRTDLLTTNNFITIQDFLNKYWITEFSSFCAMLPNYIMLPIQFEMAKTVPDEYYNWFNVDLVDKCFANSNEKLMIIPDIKPER